MLACTKAVSIKWGNFNFARTVWRFRFTACKYVSATDDSNPSFELCREVLVVCLFPITNVDMAMFTRRDAMRHVKSQYKGNLHRCVRALSHYNQ